MTSAARSGLLLINLGTPAAPTTGAVRRYLREFLSDPRVIDLPPLRRFLLVQLVIAPLRASKSAHAYRKVWTPEGSPLLVEGRRLERAMRAALAPHPVALGMRYGAPSIGSALDELVAAGVERVVAIPLYPQYADSSTGSSISAATAAAARRGVAIGFVESFFSDPGYLDAMAAVARPVIERARPDRVMFSFHGLPERQIRATDPTGARCLARPDCCDVADEGARHCYRAHSFATARGVAERLGLSTSDCIVCFQSRLGRTPWLRPFTDVLLSELPSQGVKRLVVLSASFVADCLETLEEIGIRGRESFLAAGGESLELVPALNAAPAWVDALAAIARKRLSGS